MPRTKSPIGDKTRAVVVPIIGTEVERNVSPIGETKANGMGPIGPKRTRQLSQPELEDLVSALNFDGEDWRARALLVLVNEFKRCAHDRLAIVDTCDSLIILIYQGTIACEKAAAQFAKASTMRKVANENT